MADGIPSAIFVLSRQYDLSVYYINKISGEAYGAG